MVAIRKLHKPMTNAEAKAELARLKQIAPCNQPQTIIITAMIQSLDAHDIARRESKKYRPSKAVIAAKKTIAAWDAKIHKVEERVREIVRRDKQELREAMGFLPAQDALALAHKLENKWGVK